MANYDVAIIGCGYVGLTLAAAFNKAGLKVLGVEPREEIRKPVQKGGAPFHEPGLADALRGITMARFLADEPPADAYVICVGTPLIDDGALERATHEVARQADDGSLIIVRSTVRVGTTRGLVKPILDLAGSFDLAYCPERTVEGAALKELETLPQIIGAAEESAFRRAAKLFEHVTPDGLECGIEEAETAKLLANAWRDMRFAFANEVAMICERNRVSAQNVIDVANWRYARSDIPRPGPVGGPCLVKDSMLLIEPRTHAFSVIRAARMLNRPDVFADAIYHAMCRRGFGEKGRVAVLGTAFKGFPETDDTRDSPGVAIAKLLSNGHEVFTVDPVAPADFKTIDGQRADVIVVTTDRVWNGLDEALNPGGFIYDCCGAIPNERNVVRFGG